MGRILGADAGAKKGWDEQWLEPALVSRCKDTDLLEKIVQSGLNFFPGGIRQFVQSGVLFGFLAEEALVIGEEQAVVEHLNFGSQGLADEIPDEGVSAANGLPEEEAAGFVVAVNNEIEFIVGQCFEAQAQFIEQSPPGGGFLAVEEALGVHFVVYRFPFVALQEQLRQRSRLLGQQGCCGEGEGVGNM